MGAGAGYTISVKDCDVVDLNESSIRIVKLGDWDNGLVRGGSATVKCNIKINGSVAANSYYYGCDYIDGVPMSVVSAEINLGFGNGFNKEILTPEAVSNYTAQFGVDDIESLYEELIDNVIVNDIDTSYIVDVLKHDISNLTGEGSYGGGWVHSTFDGEFELDAIDDRSGYNDTYNLMVQINNADVVEFIDKVVTGDNVQYVALDDYDIIDAFATEEEAISALKGYIRDMVLTEYDIEDVDFSAYTVQEEFYYMTDPENYGDSDWGEVVWTADESDFV